MPAFHSNPVAEDRIAESKCVAGNGAEAQERSQASEQDCADVASRNLPLRNPCRVKVGTITRSAQSALTKDGPIKATSGTSQQPSLQAAMTNTWAE